MVLTANNESLDPTKYLINVHRVNTQMKTYTMTILDTTIQDHGEYSCAINLPTHEAFLTVSGMLNLITMAYTSLSNLLNTFDSKR